MSRTIRVTVEASEWRRIVAAFKELRARGFLANYTPADASREFLRGAMVHGAEYLMRSDQD
jgi:hypothetical protein